MTPLAKIKMVSLPFDYVGLLPYRKPTNQSLSLNQLPNQPITNQRITCQRTPKQPTTSPPTPTYQSHRNKSHLNQSKSTDHTSTNPRTVKQQQCMALPCFVRWLSPATWGARKTYSPFPRTSASRRPGGALLRQETCFWGTISGNRRQLQARERHTKKTKI